MTRTRVKICGVTNVEDALAAANAGADAVGMVLHAPGRKREIPLDLGRQIAMALPPFVTAVAVVVDLHPMRLRQLVSHVPVGLVQFHGNESKTDVLSAQPIRATKVVPANDGLGDAMRRWEQASVWNLCGLVIDTPTGGGTGTPPDWDVVADAVEKSSSTSFPLTLAGGLTPRTVGDVVRRFRPWAVDVSSGVEGETVGQKDPAKIADFIAAVREADRAP